MSGGPDATAEGETAVPVQPRQPGQPAQPEHPQQPTAAGSARLATPRAYRCRCGRPVFFRNSECLACHTPLGYAPEEGGLRPLQPAGDDLWRVFDSADTAPRFHRCANLGAASCNWLVPENDPDAGTPALCRCCRLTRTLPDMSVVEHPLWWTRIEMAKRRLVSSLIGLKLPLKSKTEDPAHGMVFDLLRATPGGPRVLTGHADGVITLDVEEADDAWREQRRTALKEPYRTLLGHLRHETGHYYWQRLIDGSDWLPVFRQVFGDERQDYAAALQKHYQDRPPAAWRSRYVSAYASSHPWEDWAETWAHYLHLRDTLDTARSFGLDGERVELEYEHFGSDTLALFEQDPSVPAALAPDENRDAQVAEFLRLITNWMQLTGVLNELSRSMGVADFYPFVLSKPAVGKLHLVHRVVTAAGATA